MIEDSQRKSIWIHLGFPRIKLHGLWGIFLADFFRRIATSLIGLYIPIYIYQETGSFSKIAFYYFIYAFVGFLLAFPGAKIIQKIGIDWSIVVGTIFRAFFIMLLIFASENEVYFWLSALFFGLCQPFDWLPYHFAISKISFVEKHFGKSTGYSFIVAKIGVALGPLIGGLIITYYGYNLLYLIATSLLVFTAVVPFMDDFKKKGMYVSLRQVFNCFADKGIKKHLYAYGLEMFDLVAASIVWPVYLISVVGTIEFSGILQTISLLVAVFTTLMIGKYIDKKNLAMMKPGVVLHAVGWWGRYFFRNILGLFTFNTSFNIGSTMVWMPHKALLYARSSKSKTLEFWMIHEIICYGYLALFSLGFMVILSFIEKIDILLVVVGVISLASLLIPYLYKDYIKYLKR